MTVVRILPPDQEAAERAAVWAEAMTWLGTPYHHRATIKGPDGGVDCARFPLRVYGDLGMIEPFDPVAYSPQWHLSQMAELYLDHVRRVAAEIPREAIRLGDFGVCKHGRTYSHGFIIGEPPAVIHSTISGRCVHLGDMSRDADLLTPSLFFTLWGR